MQLFIFTSLIISYPSPNRQLFGDGLYQTDMVCASSQCFYGDIDISSIVSDRFNFMAHLLVCLMYLIYSIILSFHFFGGYNHGPCGCEVGFVTFVPAIIVENLLWSTLFLVGEEY